MRTKHEAPEEELAALRAAMQVLREENAALESTTASLRSEVRLLKTERDLLKERLNAQARRLFAASSEARAGTSEQRDLFFDEAEQLAPTPAASAAAAKAESVEVATHRRAKRGRKPLDPALPREVVRIELPEGERRCPVDGAALVQIGTEASEQYHVIPQQVRVLRTERVKYACPCCDQGMRVAPVPARIIPRGVLSEATLAWVITAKYQDGLPLYRQAALLARFGGELSRNTLAAGTIACGLAVQPLINLLRDALFECPVIHGDETEVQVLKEPGRAAQRKSYMWVQVSGVGPPIRLFTYAPTRSHAFARELYAGIKPGTVLVCDGYDAYDTLATACSIVQQGCWAHVRRGFVEAFDALPKAARTPEQPAARFIDAIRSLYGVEKQAAELSPERRLALRAEHSAPILGEIQTLLLTHLHAVVPQSALGRALHYLAGQWPKLTLFLERGDVRIDNNDCENAIRPFVIGRKNWLFSDTVHGAKASANLYSLIETAKACGVDTYRYLRHVFSHIPLATSAEDYEALLPWRVDLGEPLG